MKKVFDDLSVVKAIAEVMGVRQTIRLLYANLYRRKQSLCSDDVAAIYDASYYQSLDNHELTRTVNGFSLNYYTQFVFDYLCEEQRGMGRDVLDVGCGSGDLALALASVGARVHGIDFNDVSIAKANKKKRDSGRPVDGARFECVDLVDVKGRYDFVVLSDVVEHLSMDELKQMLGQIRKLLKDGGELLIHTPNGRTRFHRWGEDALWFSLLQRGVELCRVLKDRVAPREALESELVAAYYLQTHINVMTPRQLAEVLRQGGFIRTRFFFRQDREFPLAKVLCRFGISTDMGVVAS